MLRYLPAIATRPPRLARMAGVGHSGEAGGLRAKHSLTIASPLNALPMEASDSCTI